MISFQEKRIQQQSMRSQMLQELTVLAKKYEEETKNDANDGLSSVIDISLDGDHEEEIENDDNLKHFKGKFDWGQIEEEILPFIST